MKKPVVITSNEWQEALRQSQSLNGDVIPEGWYSVNQLREMVPEFSRVGTHTVRYHIKKMVANGLVEVQEFKTRVGNTINRMPFYRIKKNDSQETKGRV